MRKFWTFFQYRPVSDDAEDLVMKLFSATLHGEARRWYDNLPTASITSMDQFEEIFLTRWVLKMKDIQSLMRGLECINQTEDETIRYFGVRFKKLLYHILERHRPKGNYLIYLYINGLLGHLSFLLNKKGPKTLAEVHNMAIRFEKNLSLSRTNDRTVDTLNLIKLVSFETFTDDAQERREQVFNQQNEDVIKEQKPKQDDEVPTHTLPLMRSSRNLFLLHNKAKMTLVAFHFRIPMTPCPMIQEMKEKWNPRKNQTFHAAQLKMKG
jgi:hypothetical protein